MYGQPAAMPRRLDSHSRSQPARPSFIPTRRVSCVGLQWSRRMVISQCEFVTASLHKQGVYNSLVLVLHDYTVLLLCYRKQIKHERLGIGSHSPTRATQLPTASARSDRPPDTPWHSSPTTARQRGTHRAGRRARAAQAGQTRCSTAADSRPWAGRRPL